MRFLLNKLKGKGSQLLTVLFLFIAGFSFSQEIPKSEGYVTDLAGIYNESERQELSAFLKALDDSTSNQIGIYTVPDLQGYDPFSFAVEIAKKNPAGAAKVDNGVVVLIKPKNEAGKGQCFILVGRGLEGAIPDAICKRIVELEMIPRFKEGNYAGGTYAGVETLAKLAAGEIKVKNYGKHSKTKAAPIAGVILVIIVVFMIVAFSGAKNYAGRNNLGFWAALGLFNSIGSKHRGSWNNFSGGGGSSGGGFGGWGGGSFGGGGAGGSW